MSERISRYTRYFPTGHRVQLIIPHDNRYFTEWGEVLSLKGDLLTVQLSRELLPERLQLAMGNTLEVKVNREGTFFSCRTLIIDNFDRSTLFLRIIGDMTVDDLRQYYRIDVYLPFKYSIPDLQNPSVIKADWLTVREERVNRVNFTSRFLAFPHAHHAANISDQDWETTPPVAANISGGGLKVLFPEKFPEKTFINMELFLPVTPPRVLDIVGRVVMSTAVINDAGGELAYETAIAFYFIAESDRDAILSFVASQQIDKLKAIQGRMDDVASWSVQPLTSKTRMIIRNTLLTIGSVIFIYLMAMKMIQYRAGHEKNEIERTFEQGVEKYLKQLK